MPRLSITIRYANGSIYGGNVPDNGITIWEWAQAVHWVTLNGANLTADEPGVAEVSAAFGQFQQLAHPLPPLRPGDTVEVAGRRVTVVTITPPPDGEFGPVVAEFTQPYAAELIDVPTMAVAGNVPPPDGVAYVEDVRDRLWTGRGFGQWRCLTGGLTGTYAPSWQQLWKDHGPLVPLVPTRQPDALPPVPRRSRPSVINTTVVGAQYGDGNKQINHF